MLSSGLDAVGANAPSRVLTTDMVGSLPVTGSIPKLLRPDELIGSGATGWALIQNVMEGDCLALVRCVVQNTKGLKHNRNAIGIGG